MAMSMVKNTKARSPSGIELGFRLLQSTAFPPESFVYAKLALVDIADADTVLSSILLPRLEEWENRQGVPISHTP